MSKVLVVTKRSLRIEGVDVRKSLERLNIVDYHLLVYIDSEDLPATIMLEMAHLNGSINVAYVNSNPIPFIVDVVTMFGGSVIKEEGVLTAEGLGLISDSFGDTGFEVATSASALPKIQAVLKTLLQKIDDGNAHELLRYLSNENVRKSSKQAYHNLDTLLQEKDANNASWQRALKSLRVKMRDSEREKEEQALKVSKMQELYEESNLEKGMTLNIDQYPTYNVMDRGIPVMYTRVHSHCSYLTNFLLAYQHFLLNERNKVVKFLIIIPKSRLKTQQYSVFPNISSKTASLVELSRSNVYYTSEPKKNTLDTFFNQNNVQLFMVLDLTYGDKLLEGVSVKNFAAVNSLSSLSRFDLDSRKTFSCVERYGNSLMLKPIRGFTKMNREERIQSIYIKHEDIYNLLNKLLEME